MLVERLHFLLEVLYPLRSVRENVIERKLEGIALGVGCYSPKELDNLIRVNEGKRTAEQIYTTATSFP
ncbi:Uncharacterised protein [Klebsiella pneumoniae]|nr:hypothetical protein [Klebsiella pneumoniae IS39]SAT17022.1 Uncharacterised protein [Klebsiella pneumoniae]SWJ43213.1 Uncharacterised protein [Klebsiella pneumoniae]SWY69236.1 Uncharacterised protein [Klebsiella pneumoniae]